MAISNRFHFKAFGTAAAAGLLIAVSGCASSYGAGDVYGAGVGAAATGREGTVVAGRQVQIKPDQNYLGAGVGAVLGGLAGSQLGGGDTARTAGGVAGAVAGGVIGNEVSKAGNTRPGYAYTIDFGNGQLKEIVQGADVYIEPGRRVFVSFGSDRVRVTPAY